MQLLTEQTVDIACSAGAAYTYSANLEHFGEWFPGVVAIASADEAAHHTPGKRYLETVSIPMRGQQQVTITVVEAEPDVRLVTEGTLAPLLPRMEILVQPLSEASCRLTWRMFSRNDSLLARAALLPLARRVLRKRAAAGLARLKERLES